MREAERRRGAAEQAKPTCAPRERKRREGPAVMSLRLALEDENLG